MKMIDNFIAYLNNATVPYTAVSTSVKLLQDKGFSELSMTESWELEAGGSYFVKIYDTSLVAFTVPMNVTEKMTMRLGVAHTDYPCLRVKACPDMQDKGYQRLNVECYGGGIWNTWLDRPLSLAGKVCLRSEDVFAPKTVIIDLERPVLTIPNLAIHMNRDVNKGVELNKQTELLPIAGLVAEALESSNYFMDFLAGYLQVKAEDILDFDLYVYNAEKGCKLGLNEELLSASRLDNLSSCYALLNGISIAGEHLNMILLLDNEEVGSRSKQGADSALIRILLEKIYASLGLRNENLNDSIFQSMALSVDVAHGLHPAYPSKSDPKLTVVCGNGFAIKMNYSQKYATDTEAIAVLVQLCEKEGIKYQKYVNRSDIAGGSTIGCILSAQIPMKTVDVGIPILAMHSARELMAGKDLEYLINMVKVFMT